MSIWYQKFELSDLNDLVKNTMVEFLGIEFIEILDDGLVARMPVNERTVQPQGILHGGASCALAETIGSVAANGCVDIKTFYCVGLDINTNHLRSVSSGYVTGKAQPFHLGKSTQVWGINIFNEQQALISVTRLTMAVLTKR